MNEDTLSSMSVALCQENTSVPIKLFIYLFIYLDTMRGKAYHSFPHKEQHESCDWDSELTRLSRDKVKVCSFKGMIGEKSRGTRTSYKVQMCSKN